MTSSRKYAPTDVIERGSLCDRLRRKRIIEGAEKKEYVKAQKRTKTFTGCYTCRSRKIKCDMRKPYCNNCSKSKLICRGFDINLRWLEPLKLNAFELGGERSSYKTFEEDKEVSGSEYFQRSRIDFVSWGRRKEDCPYKTCEEIDKDLLILQDRSTSAGPSPNTISIGPFGIFHVCKSQYRNGHSVVKQDRGFSKSRGGSNSRRSHKEHSVNTIDNDSGTNHDNLWLSNELMDHALLTAAALNEDLQFLDLNYAFGSSETIEPSMNQESTSHTENRNDFLDLVFHGSNKFSNDNGEEKQVTSDLKEEHSTKFVPSLMFYSNYNNYYYNNPYYQNDKLEIQLNVLHSSNKQQVDSEENNERIQMPDSIMTVVENPLEPKLGFSLTATTRETASSTPSGLPYSALQVQPLARYLLSYYNTQVADLMTVIPLTENPWKTIYFPRALMAIGELLALGKTSNAKNALLNALLAVLAFNLQSKFPRNSEPMKFYLYLGIRLRKRASLFNKMLLGGNIEPRIGIEHCVNNEKYKDVLCAIMSMISVDLVWGTMEDTNFYIKFCGQVISTKMQRKKKLSSKAGTLHRIFLSLKLIQELTGVDIETLKDEFSEEHSHVSENNNNQMKEMYFQGKPNGQKQDVANPRQPGTKNMTPQFVNSKLINSKDNDENFTTDALYGLPSSLIVLFSDIVHLVRTKLYNQELHGQLPENFSSRALHLRNRLSYWKLDWNLFKNNELPSSDPELSQFSSPMHKATYHHIMSFYHALIIYFHRLIHDTPPLMLQSHVEDTLKHLNAIQLLMDNGQAKIIPLFWQGFVAGCEAVSEELQLSFKKWGSHIAQFLGSYWGARQIMYEVWRRRSAREPWDNWLSVIRDWNMNLMLN